jgi:protoheme IX farnesyltransferase
MIAILMHKLKLYAQLIKLRLSLLVVFSTAMAYLWASHKNVDSVTIWVLSIGGLLISGSANVINQILERNSDCLMKRTAIRPLPENKIHLKEAVILSFVLGISGLLLLFKLNQLCGFLSLMAFICYSFIYTPLKKISSLVVIPGAIAGSLPILIGCCAATGDISKQAILLFSIQFIWQFPHTWSIAWLLFDEYNKVGIKLMPGNNEKGNSAGFIILLSTFLIIPATLLLCMYANLSISVTWILSFAALTMVLLAFLLYKSQTNKSATHLMFHSFIYLPFILITLVLEKYL